MTTKNIGDSIEFKTPDGKTLTGVIEGRNWAFDTLVSYVVRANGVRYNVNLSGESGHSF